ncbi:PREDICTED: S-formylglutathione hydrolase-like isoform X2 [Nicotiana attenuata]|uniref:S-formylglutathione hydrolase-like isoform X2 n=1 Tax=Nicotiana attenuata TaxID=49451 RepID=UPI000904791B|nr:PREDICTED: S-formylglutathione hydrolase-like isoform X2 [Nicotiana attenuata]
MIKSDTLIFNKHLQLFEFHPVKMETKPTEISSSKMFGGYNKRYKHLSPTLGCSMNFHIFFPPSTSPSHKFPVLYWLSGLTCMDENFIAKSGAQRAASSEGVALIVPDTSPRGLNVEGESDSWDFGVDLRHVHLAAIQARTSATRTLSGELLFMLIL